MNNLTPRICLFLDIDGVMNQYRHCERIRRCHSKKIGRSKCFAPFPKKVQRLSKLIKKYNIDVYIFSAWTQKELEKFFPFNISGDTRKSVSEINRISKDYDVSILIEDEVIGYTNKGYVFEVSKIFIPHYDFGLVKKDFNNIKNYLKGL